MQTVRDIALEISKKEKIGDLNASEEWLSRFLERNKLSFRVVTNLILLSDCNALQTQILKSQPENTILIDYFEEPRRITTGPVGSRQILLKTSGFTSMRISFVLAV